MSDHDGISTFTRLYIPPTSPLNLSSLNDGTDIAAHWLAKLTPPLKAPFHKRIFWGRITEHPEQVLLITAWKTRAALKNFQDSTAGKEFEDFLKTAGKDGGAAETALVAFELPGWYFALDGTGRMKGGFAAFNMVYFPAPVTEDQRQRIGRVAGLEFKGPFHFKDAEKYCPYRRRPMKGWIEGPMEWEGQSVEAFLWCHSWKGETEERDHKASKTRKVLDVKRDADGNFLSQTTTLTTIQEKWEAELRGLGAVGWTEEHCDLHLLSRPTL
jgi:hypothetical protein